MSPGSFSLTEARLVSVFLESIFYGGYLITLGFAVGTLTRKAKKSMSFILFALATGVSIISIVLSLDLAIAFRQIWVAVIVSSSKEDGLAYLGDPTNADNLLRVPNLFEIFATVT